MASINGPNTASGVQELIDLIRGQGVKAAQDEGERIVSEARKEAASVRAKAQAEAREMLAAARAQVAADKAAGAEAIRNAARDSLLQLRNQVRQAFEVHVRRLVSQHVLASQHVSQEIDFVRSLVLVLAGQAAEKYVTDHDAILFVSSAIGASDQAADGNLQEKINHAVLGAAGVMLREGIQLLPDDSIQGGARVRLVGEDLEINMTDEALSRLLLKQLLPRYRAIVEQEEGAL
jgi:V/A-type H+-transporting ATPase subunit E